RYENGVRSRPVGKEIYSIDGELLSTIRFEYQSHAAEKPFAFSEYKDGELIRSYQLYTPFEPQKTWRDHQLPASEVARRQENQKRSDRFLMAIIDSGFDYNHIELAHQWWNNPLEKRDGIDNDGNGWVDDIFGWDQVSDSGLPSESSTNLA